MKGFDRNIKFSLMWVKKISIYTYGTAILFELWFWLLGIVEVHTVKDFCMNYVTYAVFLGGLYIFLYTAINMVTVFNQIVSYGCTRKCAALGMVCTNVLVALFQLAVNLVMYAVFNIIFGGNIFTAGLIMMAVNMYLIVIAISPLAGLAVFAWGKIGYYIIVVGTCGAAGGCIGGLIGGMEDGDTKVFSLITNNLASVHANMIVTPIAIVVIVLTAILLVKVTARTEVRG